MEELTPKVIETIRHAAKGLTGAKRREFEARVSLDYLYGDTRLTETVFGWSRHTVAKGIKEFNSGKIIPDAPRASRPKTEDANPQLARDIIELVEPDSQTDPKFQGLFKYTRLTAKAVRERLIEHKNYLSEELPHESTISNMLDRMGYKTGQSHVGLSPCNLLLHASLTWSKLAAKDFFRQEFFLITFSRRSFHASYRFSIQTLRFNL